MSSVSVQIAAIHPRLPKNGDICRWASVALECCESELCVRIVEDEESRTLNRTYRNHDKPTNVLSFPAELGGLLGDVVICAPVVEREAQDQGKTFEQHFTHMLIHGVLHLRGYDHQNDDDATAMEAREIDVLDQLNLPNPYE